MKRARIELIDEKMEHLVNLDEADKIVPDGEVSKKIYEDIFHSRDFDLCGNLMKPNISHPPRKLP
jgi:hypothetical protein